MTIGAVDTMSVLQNVCLTYKTDALECVECANQCDKGIQAIKKLDQETSGTKLLDKRQIQGATKKLYALQEYLNAASSKDPIGYIMQHCDSKTVESARTKLKNWRYTYGKDYAKISQQIREISDQIDASNTAMKKESSKLPERKIALKIPNTTGSPEQRTTRRQEEKISQNCLETIRRELEDGILAAEQEIEDYKQKIAESERKIEDNTKKIQAIRETLEIFKKKDELYV